MPSELIPDTSDLEVDDQAEPDEAGHDDEEADR